MGLKSKTPRRKLITRQIIYVGRRKGFDADSPTPWKDFIDPIINHKNFTDDEHRKYKFVEEKIADSKSPVPKNLQGKWGQIMLYCITDDTYWRIGFLELASRDESTVPDPLSCNTNNCLVLTQYDYHNKRVMVGK